LKLLKNPKITVKVEPAASDGSLLLTLKSEHPALWVRLEIDNANLPPLATDGHDLPRLTGASAPGNSPSAGVEAAATERCNHKPGKEDMVPFEDNFFNFYLRGPVTVLYRGKLSGAVVRSALKVAAVNMTWDP
jgi:hypothetical protein